MGPDGKHVELFRLIEPRHRSAVTGHYAQDEVSLSDLRSDLATAMESLSSQTPGTGSAQGSSTSRYRQLRTRRGTVRAQRCTKGWRECARSSYGPGSRILKKVTYNFGEVSVVEWSNAPFAKTCVGGAGRGFGHRNLDPCGHSDRLSNHKPMIATATPPPTPQLKLTSERFHEFAEHLVDHECYGAQALFASHRKAAQVATRVIALALRDQHRQLA